MEDKPARKDTRIAIIVIVAGLLTGAVVTWAFLQPEEQPRYSPEYPVAQSQRIPLGSAEAAPQSEGEEMAAANGEAPSAEEAAAEDADGEAEAPAPSEDTPAREMPEDADTADRVTIESAHRYMDAEGVTDYAELTEERYIRVSAKMVVDAAVISKEFGEDADPTEVRHILAEKAAEHLAEARVKPEDFWAYTRDVHSDPERAKEMGEKILREAEKHTKFKINIADVPGMEPTPVPGAGE